MIPLAFVPVSPPTVILGIDFHKDDVLCEFYKLSDDKESFEFVETKLMPKNSSLLNFDYVVYGNTTNKFYAKQISSNPVIIEDYVKNGKLTFH